MRAAVWTLLILCLCVPARGACQGDCFTCGLLLQGQQGFNTLVCLLECDAQVSPALSWDLCSQVVGMKQYPAMPAEETASKRSEDDVASASVEDEDKGPKYEEALERFRHAADALGSQQPSEEQTSEPDAEFQEAEPGWRTEDEWNGPGEREDQDGEVAVSLAKRFGGFMKGRHGFRKLVSSGRPLQKRYGGFIGIRKSARKWNNQKRVSQLLRQYLSLTGRAGRFSNLSVGVRRQNEV